MFVRVEVVHVKQLLEYMYRGWKEGGGRGVPRTIGMPDVDEELHGGRGEWVVLWELELGGEHAAFEGRVLGPLNEAFPVEDVVLGDGAGCDAFGRVVGQGAILLQQAAVGGGLSHGE